ncbi:hypothetical protein [Planctomicrobium sp. SH664]|uniref:hypothetical protein n=1 Tax=Planctomicrobium sp. SH664 TaxID=3448125 RepID=UPI003F5C58A1
MAALALVWSSVVLWSGCGEPEIQIAEVSGKVVYKGAPLPGGIISFISDSGFASGAEITPEGTFKLISQYGTGIPLGNYKVAVEVMGPGNIDPQDPNRSAKVAQMQGIKIPRRYSDPEKSGLTAEIQSGNNELTIDILEP